jgi:hypothetical protein
MKINLEYTKIALPLLLLSPGGCRIDTMNAAILSAFDFLLHCSFNQLSNLLPAIAYYKG